MHRVGPDIRCLLLSHGSLIARRLVLVGWEQLSLQDTNAQADKSFRDEIRGALATTSRQFDNMVHNLVH